MEDQEQEYLDEFEESGEDVQGGAREVAAAYKVPDGYQVEDEDSDEIWHGWMPVHPKYPGLGLVYIEGVYPDTTLTRKALQLVPKNLRKDPMLAIKESQENLMRLCIRRVGPKGKIRDVNFNEVRGKGLDRLLNTKQIAFITELFDRMTTPDEVEMETFLSSVRPGRMKG